MAKGEFVKQSFTGLPTWAKGVIAVVVVGGIGYLVYKLTKAPGQIKEGEGGRKEDRAINKELDNLNNNTATAQKLSASDALAIANKLFTAMDGYGTDTTTVEQQLNRLNNQADWLAVRAAYGIKELNPGTGVGWLVGTDKQTLEQALAAELGTFDTSMRSRVNANFKKKGITAVI